MTDTPDRSLWAGRTLALLGILFVAANMRTAVAALWPIVAEVGVDIPLSALAMGVLGMLPPVCFAVFGILTLVFTRRLGLENVLIVSLVAILVGHLARGFSSSLAGLLIGSVITFAGLGVGNVLLPPLVKKYFSDRVGLVTSLYVTVVSFSALVPPLVAVPVEDAAGWRISLGMWTVLALFALVPWITMLMRHRTSSVPSPVIEVATEERRSTVFNGIKNMLTVRSRHRAFSPYGPQQVARLDPRVFAVRRGMGAEDNILCIANVTDELVDLPAVSGVDILTGQSHQGLTLPAYGYAWIR